MMSRFLFFMLTVSLGLGLAGCAVTPSEQKNVRAPLAVDPHDPTAACLHELAGALLRYYAVQRVLPDQLTDLEEDPSVPNLTLDPATSQAFLYLPVPVPTPSDQGRILIVQLQPSRPGGRWVVLLQNFVPGGQLVAEVRFLPEAVITQALRG